MATRIKPSSRYSSFQSHQSNPTPSSDLNHAQFQLLHATSAQTLSTSRALVKAKSKSADLTQLSQRKDQNLGAMVKKFMERRSGSGSGSGSALVTTTKNGTGLAIPADFIAKDLKKTTAKKGIGSSFSGLQKKLFSKEKNLKTKENEGKALVEAKSNTRTLAMVLRSERELLSLNKEQEVEISELKAMIEGKNIEVEKLKDLCLKQREEIKSLKNAVLFPDIQDSQLHELLEKQGSELKQAKQIIPSLQREVASLTGQLQCLAEDLAEVKAEKYLVKACFLSHSSSPRTPAYAQDEAANSLEFSSEDQETPGSPDDMFLKDLNPCLTPKRAKIKSEEAEMMSYESPVYERLFRNRRAYGP